MDEELLASYLDDHLAGATAAIEIAERLAADPDLAGSMALYRQLVDERTTLEDIRTRLPVGEGLMKRALGSVGGFLTMVRDRSPLSPSPSTLDDLEALAVGIWGKRLLWGTLARVAGVDDRFADVDLGSLMARAEDQEKVVLRMRADAIDAELHLGSPAGPHVHSAADH